MATDKMLERAVGDLQIIVARQDAALRRLAEELPACAWDKEWSRLAGIILAALDAPGDWEDARLRDLCGRAARQISAMGLLRGDENGLALLHELREAAGVEK
jgi:hypothetical protein